MKAVVGLKSLWALLLVGLLPLAGWAQTPADQCHDPTNPGAIYMLADKGQQVTVCFDYPDTDRINVKFFRVRSAQTPAGAYNAITRLPATADRYQFTVTHDTHLFISTVWDELDATGAVIKTWESPGSMHIWVEARSPPATGGNPLTRALRFIFK